MDKNLFPFVSYAMDSEIDKKEVERLTSALGIHPRLVELLFCKGITSEDGIKSFLYPSKENFYDPYLMKDMAGAIERIKQAIEDGERIVVYGDYDCDGVCSSAMLYKFLTELGAEVSCHIPNREDGGYGLNVESIEKIIENCSPDLIITCDCGISCSYEVAYTLDLGVDIIVTDHHEVGDTVPECLVLNPKQRDCNYPFKQLCGAGVVLKVIQAMIGIEDSQEYFGLSAIATVADLVPLTEENRLIVQLGLDYALVSQNLGLKLLLDKIGIADVILSQDVAFKIAPRLNAAGRMGDAYRAFNLLISSDENTLATVIEEIEDDNNKRKALCSKLYSEAMEIICKEKMTCDRSIIISHPDWEKGITGIVAAKLSGEFGRPSFILVKSGDSYKGTARSVAAINLYELLSSVKDLLIEFGGHSQAAGFTITKENIGQFKSRVNEYLKSLSFESFISKTTYDLQIEIDEIDMDFMSAIDLLEPFGNSNPRPLFRVDVKNLDITTLKNTEHLSLKANEEINIFAFNYQQWSFLFRGEDKKTLILDVKLNSFRDKTRIEAYVKTCIPHKNCFDSEMIAANFIKYINFNSGDNVECSEYSNNELESLINNNIFGTLFIAGSMDTYQQFIQSKAGESVVIRETIYAINKNNYNRIIASPQFDECLPLFNYNTVIFLDTPISNGVISYINKKSSAKVYVPKVKDYSTLLSGVSLDREMFAKYYNLIKDNENEQAGDLLSYKSISITKMPDFSLKQFIVCLSVFIDLDFVKISKKSFAVRANKAAKANLKDSKSYVYLEERLSEIER